MWSYLYHTEARELSLAWTETCLSELQIHWIFDDNFEIIFPFLNKKQHCELHLNPLSQMVLMMAHNIGFEGEMHNIIPVTPSYQEHWSLSLHIKI